MNTVAIPKHFPSHNHITDRTASNWLHSLGFSPIGIKKGVYFDAHERPDVKLSRIEYLEQISQYQAQGLKLVYQNESVFMSNDGQQSGWGEAGMLF